MGFTEGGFSVSPGILGREGGAGDRQGPSAPRGVGIPILFSDRGGCHEGNTAEMEKNERNPGLLRVHPAVRWQSGEPNPTLLSYRACAFVTSGLCTQVFLGNSCSREARTGKVDALGRITSAPVSQEACFNRLWSKIVLKNSTPEECNEEVKKKCSEYYLVSPGYLFRGVPLQLPCPMLLGIKVKRKRLLVPYRKPCYGLSLYVIDSDGEEIEEIRRMLAAAEGP